MTTFNQDESEAELAVGIPPRPRSTKSISRKSR